MLANEVVAVMVFGAPFVSGGLLVFSLMVNKARYAVIGLMLQAVSLGCLLA